jgi:hypothetical protein
METEPRASTPAERDSSADGDASDVVDGPIGDAHLVDPADAAALSADLDSLPAIDDTEPADAGHARPAADPR